MTLLAANCSPALLALLEEEPDLVDLVKLHPRTLLARYDAFRDLCERRKVLLHGLAQGSEPGDPRFAAEFDPQATWRAVELAGARYLSIHIAHLTTEPEACTPGPVLDRIAADVATLTAGVPLPLHLENVPVGVPAPGQAVFPPFIGDPAFISRAVAVTGCRFLLDLAHVLVTVSYRREAAEDYLAHLPLDRVEEIHISGPAVVDGVLDDWHEEITEEGYELLERVLERCPPRVLTLEYGGLRDQDQVRSDAGVLRRQVERLRRLLGNGKGS